MARFHNSTYYPRISSGATHIEPLQGSRKLNTFLIIRNRLNGITLKSGPIYSIDFYNG
jgi:hypothetical protein